MLPIVSIISSFWRPGALPRPSLNEGTKGKKRGGGRRTVIVCMPVLSRPHLVFTASRSLKLEEIRYVTAVLGDSEAAVLGDCGSCTW